MVYDQVHHKPTTFPLANRRIARRLIAPFRKSTATTWTIRDSSVRARQPLLIFFHNFLPVTPSEVESLLSQLDPMKSSGPDLISPFDLTVACHHISTQLATLFSESLATGTLPTEFKSGIIRPILKPGKRDNSTPNSYRGISLTCVLSKVLKKIAHQQLKSYFKKQGAYHEDQYGFRTGRSVADLLLGTIDDWMIAKDRKLSTAIVFIDLSKAFDNVQQDKLLLKLQKLGVGGTVLKWFHSYLCNRTQKVAVGNCSSPSLINSIAPRVYLKGVFLAPFYLTSMFQTYTILQNKTTAPSVRLQTT